MTNGSLSMRMLLHSPIKYGLTHRLREPVKIHYALTSSVNAEFFLSEVTKQFESRLEEDWTLITENPQLSPPPNMHSRHAITRSERSNQSRCKLACEECRKRKLRCDGQEPRCGVCAESGTTCRFVSTRSNRGPKKGLMRALRIQNGVYLLSQSSIHSLF
jgi:hypothetical protein